MVQPEFDLERIFARAGLGFGRLRAGMFSVTPFSPVGMFH